MLYIIPPHYEEVHMFVTHTQICICDTNANLLHVVAEVVNIFYLSVCYHNCIF